MTDQKPNSIVRFLPSLTDLAFVLPILFLFLRMDGARSMMGDGDTGWHVRTGEWILQNSRIPHQDIFSYTKAGQPWFAWEWLWDLIFGWLHRQWGMPAVVLASIFVLCLTFALLYRLILRHCRNVFVAIAVTAAATGGSAIHWLARPHLFTLLFVVIFYWVLERAYEGDHRLLPLLPLLMVAWTNLHGGFFVAFLILASYGAGELLTWLLDAGRERRRAALARCKLLVLTGAGCLAATFVNPYTYHLYVHIYGFFKTDFYLRIISEYQSLNFQNAVAIYFEFMLVLALVAAAWSLYQKRFAHVVLLAGWAHLALFSARNLPIFMLIAAPPIARMVEELLPHLRQASVAGWLRRATGWFEEVSAEFAAFERIGRLHLPSLAAAALLVVALYIPSTSPKLRSDYDPKSYPAKALAVLRGPESQRIFTHDEWGDYLIYNLYPGKKVFVDGRFDMYGPKFGEKYLDVMNVKYDWEDNLSRYGVDTILLPVNFSLAGALKQSRHWRVVYDDGIAIVFRSVTPPPDTQIASGTKDGGSAVPRAGGKNTAVTKSQTKRS